MARTTQRSGQTATIKAVAERAGVSAMTVSNVVNGTRKVREATRDAVLSAVRDLGYTPNMAARALASAGANKLGVVCGDTENAFLSSLLVGVVEATTRIGAQILLSRIDAAHRDRIEERLDALIRSEVSAILVAPPFCEAISASGLVDRIKVPVVALCPGDALSNLSSVRVDDFGAAREATRLLIRLGHRRIGFIRAASNHIVSRTRRDGYFAALDEAGLDRDRALIVDGELTFASGLQAAERLLAIHSRPTAIFASNDDMAAAVVSVAHRAGLRVPEELSVVGFDDGPIAVKLWPTLTTVRQPIARIADRATTLAFAMARAGDTPVETHYVAYDLIERGSTAPPP